jgi:hypothetical protein
VKNLPLLENFFSSEESSGDELSGEEFSGKEFSVLHPLVIKP